MWAARPGPFSCLHRTLAEETTVPVRLSLIRIQNHSRRHTCELRTFQQAAQMVQAGEKSMLLDCFHFFLREEGICCCYYLSVTSAPASSTLQGGLKTSSLGLGLPRCPVSRSEQPPGSRFPSMQTLTDHSRYPSREPTQQVSLLVILSVWVSRHVSKHNGSAAHKEPRRGHRSLGLELEVAGSVPWVWGLWKSSKHCSHLRCFSCPGAAL